MQFLNKIKPFVVLLFISLYLLSRILRLHNDEINPDAVNWHFRSEQFVVALKTFNLEKTYQHYHPGVTLMWIMGVPVELMKQFIPEYAGGYNHETFPDFHYVSKLFVVGIQAILTILIFYFLNKAFGFWLSLGTVSVLSFEPFFLGNSRLLHLDALLTLFLFLGLVLLYNFYLDRKWFYVFLSAMSLSLAFLTKSIAIGALGFAGLFFIVLLFKEKGRVKKNLNSLILFIITFVLTSVLVLPALIVRPYNVLDNMFSEGERVGVRSGHNQIVLGEETISAGYEFYPLVMLIKFSPLLVIGSLLGLYFALRNIKSEKLAQFVIYLGVFYLTYLIVMSVPTKKIDRYIVVVFPLFAALCVYGFYKLFDVLKSRQFLAIIPTMLLIFASYVYPLIYFYPYYFTYTSLFVGTPENANRLVAQKSFGIGVFELKDRIFKRFGEYPRIGFIDKKPMQAIYMNSRISDVRVAGASSYQVLVLAINEEIPENLQEEMHQFEHVDSMYINGLEYWRIYAKKN